MNLIQGKYTEDELKAAGKQFSGPGEATLEKY